MKIIEQLIQTRDQRQAEIDHLQIRINLCMQSDKAYVKSIMQDIQANQLNIKKSLEELNFAIDALEGFWEKKSSEGHGCPSDGVSN
jgi:hypothetical protein